MNCFDRNISLPLSDVIATFDSVGGVIYTDSENDDILLMPYNTMAKCWVTECDVLDAKTRSVIETNRLIPTDRLYEAVDTAF